MVLKLGASHDNFYILRDEYEDSPMIWVPPYFASFRGSYPTFVCEDSLVIPLNHGHLLVILGVASQLNMTSLFVTQPPQVGF